MWQATQVDTVCPEVTDMCFSVTKSPHLVIWSFIDHNSKNLKVLQIIQEYILVIENSGSL